MSAINSIARSYWLPCLQHSVSVHAKNAYAEVYVLYTMLSVKLHVGPERLKCHASA